MFDIIGKRFRFFLISGVVILIGVISLLTVGLKPGIEFTSGSLLTVDFEQVVEQGELKQALADLDYANVIIQRTGAGDFLIRTRELTAEDKAQLEEGLETRF
ncbi:MAG: protein translocase subunit SecF, partial [Dehalococcoidales bacterium]